MHVKTLQSIRMEEEWRQKNDNKNSVRISVISDHDSTLIFMYIDVYMIYLGIPDSLLDL